MAKSRIISGAFSVLAVFGLLSATACAVDHASEAPANDEPVANDADEAKASCPPPSGVCKTVSRAHGRCIEKNVSDGTACSGGTCQSGTCVASAHDAGSGGQTDAGSGGSTDSGSGGSTDAGSGGSTDSGSGGSTDSGTSNGFDQFQNHNLATINAYRASVGSAPLVLNAQLNTFAQAGSVELSQDHLPHQHFITAANNGTLWTSGFSGSAGENQGDPNGWFVMSSDPTTNELNQIDSIMAAMWAEGPGGGHYENMKNPNFHKVGVGLLEVGGKLYLTNDFSM